MLDTLLYAATGVPMGSLASDIGTPTTAEITHPFWIFEWDLIYQPEVAVCSFILFFAGILCSAAGIGGGGIYVAVLMVTGRLTPHNAVPLSKAIVFFGAIASLIVNLFYSVRKKANVIDTDACRLVVPATLIGTFLGVLLNRHTSDYLIVVLLTCLLGMMTGLVARTARLQAIEEHQQDARELSLSSAATGDGNVTADNDGGSGGASGSSQQPVDDGTVAPVAQQADENTPILAPQIQVIDDDNSIMVPAARKQIPNARDGVTGGALLLIVVTGGILRFHMHACRAEVLGDLSKTGACNHPVNMIFRHHMETWMRSDVTAMVLQQLVWTLPIWTCVAITVHFGFVANREVGWRTRSIVTYQVVAILTGLLAGLVGVGGGLILSPFFLLTGMEPSVAVGTSATCVLFTSSSTTMQYIFTDRIIMSLALVYGIVTSVASFAGTCLVHYVQDKFARKSYVTTIVAVGVAISAMLSVVKFVYLVVNPNSAAETQIKF